MGIGKAAFRRKSVLKKRRLVLGTGYIDMGNRNIKLSGEKSVLKKNIKKGGGGGGGGESAMKVPT